MLDRGATPAVPKRDGTPARARPVEQSWAEADMLDGEWLRSCSAVLTPALAFANGRGRMEDSDDSGSGGAGGSDGAADGASSATAGLALGVE